MVRLQSGTDPLRVLRASPRRSGRKLNHKASRATKIQKNTPTGDFYETCAILELGNEQLNRKERTESPGKAAEGTLRGL